MTTISRLLMSGVAALVITAGSASLIATPTFAQGQQNQAGQGEGGQGQGGQGEGGQGQGGPGDNVGGEEEDSDRRGPQYGQPDEGEDRGGKPAWSAEGIPEVELGRLSVIRSPDQVLDRALAEALANYDAATMEDYYEMTAAEFANEAETDWDNIVIFDSPLQNLALLQDLWEDGQTSLPGVEPANLIELSAIFIGVASDKNLSISDDTVRALAIISGVTMSDELISSIASKAEDVRLAVLIGHG